MVSDIKRNDIAVAPVLDPDRGEVAREAIIVIGKASDEIGRKLLIEKTASWVPARILGARSSERKSFKRNSRERRKTKRREMSMKVVCHDENVRFRAVGL